MRRSNLDYGSAILIKLEATRRFNRDCGVRRWTLAVYPLCQYGIVGLLDISVCSVNISHARPFYSDLQEVGVLLSTNHIGGCTQTFFRVYTIQPRMKCSKRFKNPTRERRAVESPKKDIGAAIYAVWLSERFPTPSLANAKSPPSDPIASYGTCQRSVSSDTFVSGAEGFQLR